MSAASRTLPGLVVLGGAACFGVVADILANVAPSRVDTALGLGALLLIGGALARRGWVTPPPEWKGLGVLLMPFLAALVWRDSATLFALNVAAVLGLLVLATPWVQAAGWRRAGATDGLWGAAQLGLGAVGGAGQLLLGEIDWHAPPLQDVFRRVVRIGIGLVIAVPVTLIFGVLLAEADPVFGRLASRVVQFDRFACDVAIVVVWSWVAAGVLQTLMLEKNTRPRAPTSGGRFGLSEIGPVLAVVDLLFLGFVLVQVHYLFGGSGLVGALTGLSYAEYARRGFFELVAVAALTLPLLLMTDWVLDKRDPRLVRRFRLLALLMLVLLAVILASALQRMRLYTQQYGLTELRLYTSAFMGWLTLVFGWFVATVLRGRRHLFVGGAVSAALLVLVGLNLANPDAVIARVNLGRAAQGARFDAAYAAVLSADALPVLIDALPSLTPDQRCRLIFELHRRWGSQQSPARWTLALHTAAELVASVGPSSEISWHCGPIALGRRLPGMAEVDNRLAADPAFLRAALFPDVVPARPLVIVR